MAQVIPLASRWRATLFLLLVAAPAALLLAETARIVTAQLLAKSDDASDLKRAIALDPSNPELHYRLGMLYLSSKATDSAPAISSLHKAIELNPNHANYWRGLAQGCYQSGDAQCAARGFARAIQLAPMRPSMEWEAAAFYSASGQIEASFGHLRRLLALNPDSAPEVLALVWRCVDDPTTIWQQLVAPSHCLAVQCAYLDFLAENNRYDLTGRYWAELVASSSERRWASGAATAGGNPPALSFAAVKPYLEQLLAARQYEQALTVWRDLLRLGVIPSTASGGLLYNGSFEQPIFDAGFDWHLRREEYITLNCGGAEANQAAGAVSGLRIDFTVPHNAEHEPVYQFVPVTPGDRYVLRGWLRSEGITSDSGPRLRVIDPRHPQELDASTVDVTGTAAWHEVSIEFTAGASPVVRISVWRPRSRSYPMDISGRVWVDHLSLRRLGAAAVPASAAIVPNN